MNCKICCQRMKRHEDELHRKTFYCRNTKCGDKLKDNKTLYEKLIEIKKRITKQ